MALQVYDGNCFDPVVAQAKQNAEGEGAEQATSDVSVYKGEKIRVDSRN